MTESAARTGGSTVLVPLGALALSLATVTLVAMSAGGTAKAKPKFRTVTKTFSNNGPIFVPSAGPEMAPRTPPRRPSGKTLRIVAGLAVRAPGYLVFPPPPTTWSTLPPARFDKTGAFYRKGKR